MINDTAEKCLGCTIKHLTEVLVAINDIDTPEKLRAAYVCGNLSHAANHFMHYNKDIADQIRELRLDCINTDLTFALPLTEIVSRLEDLTLMAIKSVENNGSVTATKKRVERQQQTGQQTTVRGCRCGQKK